MVMAVDLLVLVLAADMLGNIRTQTMRAFTTSEMEKILAKVP